MYGLQASGYWNARTEGTENVVSSAWARYRIGIRNAWRCTWTPKRPSPTNSTPTSKYSQGATPVYAAIRTVSKRVAIRFRVTAEERFYTDWYLARVLRVAAAAFVDVGRAWGSSLRGASPSRSPAEGSSLRGASPSRSPAEGSQHDNDVLANVGVGLRFESTRTDRSLVYHIDLAFPVVDAPGTRGAEITLTSKRNL